MTTCKQRRPNAVLNTKRRHEQIFARYIEMVNEQKEKGKIKYLSRNYYWENLADEFGLASTTVCSIVNKHLKRTGQHV